MLKKLTRWFTAAPQEPPAEREPFPRTLLTVTENPLSYQEQTRWELQEKFDNPPQNKTLTLVPQEYAGPLFITKPMTIDGQGATLWAFKGPVLHLSAPTVTLKNLNIEVTGETFNTLEEECAVCVEENVNLQCENVNIRGQVVGLEGENGSWHYPHSLHLGQLAANLPHQFLIHLIVPMPCQIESAISGVHLAPHTLLPGNREILLKIEPLHQDTSLYGNLYLKTARLKRRIHLTAYITSKVSSQPAPTPILIWSSPHWQKSSKAPVKPTISKRDENSTLTSQATPSVQKSLTQPDDEKTYRKVLENSVFFTDKPKPNRLLSEPETPPNQNRSLPEPKEQDKTNNIFFKQGKK